ncbi:MAG: LacI family transcriptional regulator [Lachnospiraceae bacterium]|nr:LacI family transcriptional regulator [Lachnospiraceae bacterium]
MSTAKDVALKAGVSIATVARIMNNDERYSYKEETRQAVLNAAEVLNYSTPSHRKQAKKEQVITEERIILLVCAHMVTDAIDGAQRACDELGYMLYIRKMRNFSDESFEQYLDDKRVKAVIFLDYIVNKDIVRKYPLLPMVQINEFTDANYINSITINETSGTREMTDYLVEKGRKRLCVVGFDYKEGEQIPAADRRTDGARMSLMKAGLDIRPDFFVSIPAQALEQNDEKPFIRFRKLLQLPEGERPDMVYCNGARVSAVCMRYIQEEGLRVPEDIAIACTSTDDHSSKSVLLATSPQISGIFAPMKEMGYEAVRTAQVFIDRPNSLRRRVVLPYSIIYRESTP